MTLWRFTDIRLLTLPMPTVSLEESATCCTASWAAFTETTDRECVGPNPLLLVPLERQSFGTCSVCYSGSGRLTRAFQTLKGFLERGHGCCLGLLGFHTSIWAQSCCHSSLIPSVWHPTPASPAHSNKINWTNPSQRIPDRLESRPL